MPRTGLSVGHSVGCRGGVASGLQEPTPLSLRRNWLLGARGVTHPGVKGSEMLLSWTVQGVRGSPLTLGPGSPALRPCSPKAGTRHVFLH